MYDLCVEKKFAYTVRGIYKEYTHNPRELSTLFYHDVIPTSFVIVRFNKELIIIVDNILS